MKRYLKYAAVPLVALIIYFTAYATTGNRFCAFRNVPTGGSYCGFSYQHDWQARLFVPAGIAESFCRRKNIALGTQEAILWYSRNYDAK